MCCTQYASKFGKLSSGQRTEKVSFHSNPKERQCQRMFKLLHSCTHLTLAQQCSKFSKPGFNSTWILNLKMFKLNLEKAEEQEIKLPKSAGSSKKQESSRKTSTSVLLTMPKSVWTTTNWKILKDRGIPDHLTCLLRNLYAGQEATVRTGHGTTDRFQIGEGVCQGCILSLCLTYMQSTSWETLG